MKLSLDIENINGVYNAQVGVAAMTTVEEQKLLEFGEFLIDAGGAFSASVNRPDQVNTTAVIDAPSSGTRATATPIINAYGVITGFTITNGGSGYDSTPAIVISGDGHGAAATVTVVGGAVTAITVTNGGYGYHVTPVAVSFVLPTQMRRVRSDFPIRQSFDLADFPDADARAKVWIDTIQSRITSGKQAWLAQVTPLLLNNIITI